VGIKITGVNYKSSADAQTDMLAGRSQAMFVTVASTLGQIESGDLRLLAYTDSNHPADSPAAPTMAEAGFPGMEKAQIWWGIFGPHGMPTALVQAVNQAVNQAVGDPAVVAFLAKSGAAPVTTTPERFIAMIHDEAALFASLAGMIMGK
jgi:tripartite-type tricarboxylate transporter receptor subunit TctC